MRPTATYRCLGCSHEWRHVPAPTYSNINGRFMGYALAAECPKCGHLYLERQD